MQNRAVALLDVDKTLIRSNQEEVNKNLLQALLQQGITDVYLFTNMSMNDVQNIAKDPNHFSRPKLIDILRANGFTVHGVITPADPSYNQGLGAAYETFLVPQYQRVAAKKLKPENLSTDPDFRQANQLFDQHLAQCSEDYRAQNFADRKGIMFRYFLANKPANLDLCYFFDDGMLCLESARQANEQQPQHNVRLKTVLVKKQPFAATSVDEYVAAMTSPQDHHVLADGAALATTPAPASAAKKENKMPEFVSSHDLLHQLYLAIIKEDVGGQFKRWDTRLLGGKRYIMLDSNNQELGRYKVTRSMNKMLETLTAASEQIKLHPDHAATIYLHAVHDCFHMLEKAASQNNSIWYSGILGRKTPAKNFYTTWYNAIRPFVATHPLNNQRILEL